MANPNALNHFVKINIFITIGQVARAGFGTPLLVSGFPASIAFPTRIKRYAGSSAAILQAILNDGFALDSAVYRMAAATLAPSPKIIEIYIGREDALDANVTTTMNAIALENSDGWYPFAYDTRAKAEIIELAQWAETKFHWYMGLTKDVDVLDKLPGNVVDSLVTFQKTALVWRDALALATAATMTSTAETFNLSDGDVLNVAVDGGPIQQVIFSATASEVTSGNPETYLLANGNQFNIAVNGGPLQTITFSATAASTTTLNQEPFNLSPNQILNVQVDGGPIQVATFLGTAGEQTSGNVETFPLVDGDDLQVSVDLAPAQVITFSDNVQDFPNGIGLASAAEVAAVINAQISGASASAVGGAVVLASAVFGTDSGMEITGGTANAIGKLNFPAGVNAGTGDAANLAAATAPEVQIRLQADIPGQTTTLSGTRVSMTSNLVGTSSSIRVTGGNANGGLQFDTVTFFGTGDAADISATTALEVVEKFNAALVGASAEVDGSDVKIISDIAGTDSSLTNIGGNANIAFGFPANGTPGLGDFADISQATSQEVVTKLNFVLVGVSAQKSGLLVKLTSNTVTTASSLLVSGNSNLQFLFPEDLVTGTGTDEDYIECAWLGRCLVADLDTEQINWNGQILPGFIGDKITAAQRANLLDQKVNVLDFVDNRMRFGTLIYPGLYIDNRTTADWLEARLTEDIQALLNKQADMLKKLPLDRRGVSAVMSVIRARMQAAETAKHIDGTWVDKTSFPEPEEIPTEDYLDRLLRFIEQGATMLAGINKVDVTINLGVGN